MLAGIDHVGIELRLGGLQAGDHHAGRAGDHRLQGQTRHRRGAHRGPHRDLDRTGQKQAAWRTDLATRGRDFKTYPLEVLAATSPSRSAATKSLPLMATTLPGFDYNTWYAMYVPLNTPKAVADSINMALSKALKTPALVAKIEAAGTELQPGSAEEVQAWTQRDTEKWAKVIRDAQITID